MHLISARDYLQLTFAFLLGLAGINPAWASTVDGLLAQDKAPPGVVFEIVERDAQALEWAVPLVAQEAKRLRQKFPNLDIAVVTHGQEMFALQANQKKANRQIHTEVEQLVKSDKVAVHVCGTHASWRQLDKEHFVDFVDFGPAAPSQIRNYRDLGFVVVRLRQPE